MLGSSRGKGKDFNLSPIHEDKDLDEMRRIDSGNFPTIDTLDDDDDVDIEEDDLSRNIKVWNYMLTHFLIYGFGTMVVV